MFHEVVIRINLEPTLSQRLPGETPPREHLARLPFRFGASGHAAGIS